MIPALRLSVLSTLLVVSASALTYGQSQAGWVLWERVRHVEKVAAAPITETITWEPYEGYEDLRSCRIGAAVQARMIVTRHEAILKEFGDELRKDGSNPLRAEMIGEAEAVTTLSNPTLRSLQTTAHRFVCFPGGTDPRPRTGQ